MSVLAGVVHSYVLSNPGVTSAMCRAYLAPYCTANKYKASSINTYLSAMTRAGILRSEKVGGKEVHYYVASPFSTERLRATIYKSKKGQALPRVKETQPFTPVHSLLRPILRKHKPEVVLEALKYELLAVYGTHLTSAITDKFDAAFDTITSILSKS
jgi:hypothetical protein